MYETALRFADQISSLTIAIVLFFIVALLFEKLRPADKNIPFFHRETKFEIMTAYLMMLVFWPLGKFAFDFLFLEVLTQNFIHDTGFAVISTWPSWLRFITCLVALDLLIYAHHRFAHVFLWPFHAVHHDAKNVNWSTSWRFHPAEILLMIFDMAVLLWIGFPADSILYAAFVVNLASNFTHFNTDLKWKGLMKYILASPHFHRWHHALDRKATDSNMCFVFPFIDLIFGTYYCPDEKPEEFGIFHKDMPDFFFAKWLYAFIWEGRQIRALFSRQKK